MHENKKLSFCWKPLWRRRLLTIAVALIIHRYGLRVCQALVNSLIYLRWVRWPLCNFATPEIARTLHGDLLVRNVAFGGGNPYPATLNASCFPGIPNSKHFDVEGSCGKLGVWEIRAEKPIWNMVYCHGNACNRGSYHRVLLYEMLRSLGVTVYAFDYRGFGDSNTGALNQEGLAADAIAVLRWAKTRNRSKLPWAFWGHSLGSGVVLQAAQMSGSEDVERHMDAIILECPFTSIPDVIQETRIPFRLLPKALACSIVKAILPLNSYFNSLDRIRSCPSPVLLIHGAKDTAIPVAHSKALCDQNTTGVCQLVVFEGGFHDDCVLENGFASTVEHFLQRCAASRFHIDDWAAHSSAHRARARPPKAAPLPPPPKKKPTD
eukprot:GEMP01025361.1.p1 GENE.GEMP01025361.1~~GEMP01025361.1.p1  ORF type:complete len:378 (+),score=63.45 GEMP01025361.1:707-1840(+)